MISLQELRSSDSHQKHLFLSLILFFGCGVNLLAYFSRMFRMKTKNSGFFLRTRLVFIIALFSVALFEYEHIKHHILEANEPSPSSETVGFHDSVFHSWSPTETIDTSKIYIHLVEQFSCNPDVAIIPEEHYLQSDPRAPPASC